MPCILPTLPNHSPKTTPPPNKMKDKGFKTLLIISIILAVLDFGTTVRLGSLVKYTEANPLYRFGGLYIILFLNALIFGYFWWCYTKSKKSSKMIGVRFGIINLLVSLGIIRLFVIWNNWNIGTRLLSMPKDLALQTAQLMTPEMKVEAFIQVSAPLWLFACVAYIVYLFYRADHDIKVKGDLDS